MTGSDKPSESSKLLPGDETEPGSKQSAEGICLACGGSGEQSGRQCADCGGTGIVTVIVGDA
ncbi:MAG TPA: hypothetical protein VGO22_23300 [Pseudorhizobium sp.]|jgi:hypothetical protein|nr:hypothetical protein [Pseudorhizobium sp.]